MRRLAFSAGSALLGAAAQDAAGRRHASNCATSMRSWRRCCTCSASPRSSPSVPAPHR
ncbi:MAG: hypothetical protein MZW92_48935 [Comamonadaceae bacterium]|nr:hypothetical protein [Comamonadaceae bacterium]